jgi:hypothetical protein
MTRGGKKTTSLRMGKSFGVLVVLSVVLVTAAAVPGNTTYQYNGTITDNR